MPQSSVQNTSPSQRERLWQIDFLARFRGHLSRHDLAQRFEIALSNATRDFTLYRELAPHNLDYDHKAKLYRRSGRFKPLFSYDREHTLQALTLGQSMGLDACHQPILVDAASNLNQPDLDILATVSRAIYASQPLRITYVSVSSGEHKREIIPHSLVNTGLRWHVRAYCRKRQGFLDFVLTRITAAKDSKTAVNPALETIEQDELWHRLVEVELVPHPKAPHRKAIELDYNLQPGHSLQLSLRAATAGYLLRRWGVDCSPGATLSPDEYQLALCNPHQVGSLADLSIAPGFARVGDHS